MLSIFIIFDSMKHHKVTSETLIEKISLLEKKLNKDYSKCKESLLSEVNQKYPKYIEDQIELINKTFLNVLSSQEEKVPIIYGYIIPEIKDSALSMLDNDIKETMKFRKDYLERIVSKLQSH